MGFIWFVLDFLGGFLASCHRDGRQRQAAPRLLHAVVSFKQLVDCCPTRFHLLGGWRAVVALVESLADALPLPGGESPLASRRSVPSQHVTQGRITPPSGNRT